MRGRERDESESELKIFFSPRKISSTTLKLRFPKKSISRKWLIAYLYYMSEVSPALNARIVDFFGFSFWFLGFFFLLCQAWSTTSCTGAMDVLTRDQCTPGR